MSEAITVLLVDDHAMVRQGVRTFLETQADLSVVGEAGSGEEAVGLAAQHVPERVKFIAAVNRPGGVGRTVEDE